MASYNPRKHRMLNFDKGGNEMCSQYVCFITKEMWLLIRLRQDWSWHFETSLGGILFVSPKFIMRK